MGQTRQEFKDKHDPSPELIHLRSEVERLQGIVDEGKRTSGEVSEAMTAILEHVHVAKAPTLVYKENPKSVATPVTEVVQLTDWHIGQTTKPQYIEEFGEYSYNVAVRRVNQLQQNIIDNTTVKRAGYQVNKCHVIGTADWISGNIHEELVMTNEFPAPVQAIKAGYLLGQFVAGLSPHFSEVEVDLLTTGNHDRITKKPQSEDGGLNSWGYIACEIARQHVSAIKNVKIRVHPGLSRVIEVGGLRYLIYHGHKIKGTFGIPFYGIERKKQKEAMARMNMAPENHFNRIIIGHFHTALNHEHWMIGGSLPGTTAHDHEEGRHSQAHQTSWYIHPKHGEFDWTRWWLT